MLSKISPTVWFMTMFIGFIVSWNFMSELSIFLFGLGSIYTGYIKGYIEGLKKGSDKYVS